MGATKRQFTQYQIDEERLVKAIFGCTINELPDTPESELIRMEVEEDLKREKIKKLKEVATGDYALLVKNKAAFMLWNEFGIDVSKET